MDWISAALAGASALFGESDSDKARAASKAEYKWGTRFERYRALLDDWKTQKDKAEKRAGAAEYAKFSSLDQWAPGYRQTYVPPVVSATPPQPQEY